MKGFSMIKNHLFIFLTVIYLFFCCDIFSSWKWNPKVEGGRPIHHLTQNSIHWPDIPKKVWIPLVGMGGLFTLWKIDEIYHHNKTVEEINIEKNKLNNDYNTPALTANEKRTVLNNYIYNLRDTAGFFEGGTFTFLRQYQTDDPQSTGQFMNFNNAAEVIQPNVTPKDLDTIKAGLIKVEPTWKYKKPYTIPILSGGITFALFLYSYFKKKK